MEGLVHLVRVVSSDQCQFESIESSIDGPDHRFLYRFQAKRLGDGPSQAV
jgi:hypothetical protein